MLNRRELCTVLAARALAREARPAPRKQRDFRASWPLITEPGRTVTRIGSHTLEQLRTHFAREFGETVGYWEQRGIDREFGGFLFAHSPRFKQLYDQGRILWLYSYFYNHFGKKPAHLEAARQGKEALVRHALLADGHWATRLSRDWTLETGFFDIYADIYMILGLGEYYRASGDANALELARKTAYKVNQTVLAPDYQGQGHGPFYEPGIKRLGTWLHFLSALTPLLRYSKDEGIERIARFCVRAMIEKHWQRDGGFLYEYLDHEFKPYSYNHLSEYGADLHCATAYHSIQAAWMTMDEALRAGSRAMFRDGLEMGFDTLALHWEEGAQCGFNMYSDPVAWRPVGNHPRITEILAEAMVFLLTAVEHTQSPVALRWWDTIFACAQPPRHSWDRANTLHQPRAIMFCLQALNRMISRQGRASGFFSRKAGERSHLLAPSFGRQTGIGCRVLWAEAVSKAAGRSRARPGQPG